MRLGSESLITSAARCKSFECVVPAHNDFPSYTRAHISTSLQYYGPLSCITLTASNYDLSPLHRRTCRCRFFLMLNLLSQSSALIKSMLHVSFRPVCKINTGIL